MGNPRDALSASNEKIKRAQSKFDYLKLSINQYIATQPYATRVEEQGDTHYFIASRQKEPPDDWAFEVVEAVGHLRSALDKMTVALVEKNGCGISGVGFPFGGLDNGKPDVFPNRRMENGIKKKLSPEQWKLIESYRPYPGGNDTLWAINQVANADKHGKDLVNIRPMLVRNGVGVGRRGDSCKADLIYAGLPENDPFSYDKEREEVVLTIVGLSGQLTVNRDTTPEIVFGEIAPVEGMNILVALNQQIRITDSIIKSFRNAFF